MALDIEEIKGTPAKVAARLCNFSTAHSYLQLSHQDWLDKNVGPVVRSLESPWVDLFGYASRLGNAKFNQDLSFQRCEAVKSWVSNYSEKTKFAIEWAKGASESEGDERNNDGYWRAVEIYVYAFERPKPPPPPSAPPIPVNTNFKLRLRTNLNISQKVAADFAIFQIWDEKAGLSSLYTYWGGGAAGGIPGGPWLSATLPGPWNDCPTNKPIAVNQFGGAARFTAGGAGPFSLNYVNFMSLPPGAATVPNPLPINTGFTIGIGAQTSVGYMRLEKLGTASGALPFSGP